MPRLLIWDSNDEPPETNEADLTVCWRGYRLFDDEGITSILPIVENNAEEVRQAYLTWVQNIADCSIRKKSVVRHFNIRKNFSFWWTTLISEKSNFSKSPQIDDIIRVIAVEKFLFNPAVFDEIEVYSNKKSLAFSFKNLVTKYGLVFQWKKIKPTPASRKKFSLMFIFFRLPSFLQAVIWSGHYFYNRWSFRGIELEKWSLSQADLTFISYFFNLEKNAVSRGIFRSNYWASLPESISVAGKETNWLHIFVKDKNFSNSQEVIAALKKLNSREQFRQNHIVLESFLSLKVVAKSFFDWGFVILRAMFVGNRLKNIRSNIVLWPLIEEDWKESFFGVTSISNIIMLNLFENAFSKLPTQNQGIFLLENQGWEMAMCSAWRDSGHKSIIGCPHSTVRFWDFRHFFDNRIFDGSLVINAPPLADRIAVNGPVARAAFINNGFPANRLVDVEALRYLYLEDLRLRQKSLKKISRPLRLLVVGDYVASHTHCQMTLLSQLDSSVLNSLSIVAKPHPATPIDPALYRDLEFSISELNVSELLLNSDIVYASALTSASVDAFCSGLPVIVALDPSSLNLSPLRNCPGVLFISSTDELREALRQLEQSEEYLHENEPFFYVGSNLDRWRQLLDF